VNELMRATIQEALDVHEPAGLRSRVIASVPMERRRRRPGRVAMPRLQWATAFAAIVLTAALLAALVYSRIGPLPAVTHHPHAPGLNLAGPEGIAVGPDGTVYIADYLSNRIFRMQNDGTLATFAGGGLLYEGPAKKANIFGPVGIAVRSDGDIFFAENPGATIRRIDHGGYLSTYAAQHPGGTALSPWGVAISPSGSLYASMGGGVALIHPDGLISPISLAAVPAPAVWPGYITFDSAGNLYVSDMAPASSSVQLTPVATGGCRILRIAPDNSVAVIAGTGTCGYSGDGGPAAKAELNDPQGIAFDAAGNLYFADSHNHRLRRIDTHGIITTVAGTGREGDNGDGGPAVNAELAYLGGMAAQAPFLYVSEQETASGNYGAIRAIDLRTGTIRTMVNSRSRVVS
jgi:sugar lactone lactonase YvrE